MRLRLPRRLATVSALLLTAVTTASACVPAGTPMAPFKDADNGTPTDHGWFQGGKVWRGDFGDPHVIRIGSTYYAYASPVGGRYLPLLTSTDLKTWYIHPQWSTAGPPGTPGYDVNSDPAIPAEIRASADAPWDKYNNNDALVSTASWGLIDPQNKWMNKDYWAPGVFSIGNTWYAYSPVRVSWNSDDPHHYGRFCITVASAPSPFGPFRDISGNQPIQCQPADEDPAGSIDPFPFHDPVSGKNYLLWKAAGKVGVRDSRLLATELGNDGKPLPGAPVTTLLSTNHNAPWEGQTIENPAMIDYNGTYYLFYSANFQGWTDDDGRSNYATGYAICPQGPLGACYRPQPQTPLLASNGVDQGPGGATAFTDPGNGLHLAYATYWLGENRNGYHPRRLHVVSLLQQPDRTLRVGATP